MNNMFATWEDITELELFMDDFIEETAEASNCSSALAMSDLKLVEQGTSTKN
jgi:hypothetical protein